MAKVQKWTEDRTAQLVEAFPVDTYVTQEAAAALAEEMETTTRSITSKLRKMGYNVQLASEVSKGSNFSEEATEQLQQILESSPGEFTFAELAEKIGTVSAKQIQGKVLSLELNDAVKPTPKAEVVKKYTDAEEATLLQLVSEGAYIEDIAEALNKECNSIRGKALSLLRAGTIDSIPKQKNTKPSAKADPLAGLENITEMTVAAIAEAVDKSERGIKTMLTRRGITVADYDGAAKAEKSALASA